MINTERYLLFVGLSYYPNGLDDYYICGDDLVDLSHHGTARAQSMALRSSDAWWEVLDLETKTIAAKGTTCRLKQNVNT